MSDLPSAPDIIQLVARYLRDMLLPQLSGHAAFNTRVAANALDLACRELELGPAAMADECQRLCTLLGRRDNGALEHGGLLEHGGVLELNAELCRRIRDGEMTDTHRLAAHLWATTLAKLAVDQPNYVAYRAELSTGGDATASS